MSFATPSKRGTMGIYEFSRSTIVRYMTFTTSSVSTITSLLLKRNTLSPFATKYSSRPLSLATCLPSICYEPSTSTTNFVLGA